MTEAEAVVVGVRVRPFAERAAWAALQRVWGFRVLGVSWFWGFGV